MTCPKKILMVSGDLLPFCDGPVGGAGLRTWGLGEGLRYRGHEVIYALPEKARPMVMNTDFTSYTVYDPLDFRSCLKKIKPEIIVFQSWTQVLLAHHFDGPVVLDFHGSTMLEVQYQGGERLLRQRIKLEAIRRADFFTCAGEYQRHYFWAWLMMVGIKVEMDTLVTIPVSFSPELPAPEKESEIIFVYGGTFLQWQNPEKAIYLLIEALRHKDKGLFRFYGGDSVLGKDSDGKFLPLLNQLKKSPRVEIRGHLSHRELIREYLKASLAIDLMERNPERELAFTTRTIEYLWCGLPVIYNNYAELSPLISDYQAGWVLDPADEAGLKRLLEEILDDNYDLKEYSLKAQGLVRDKFTWDKTVLPLAQFCSSPSRRKHTTRIKWNSHELRQLLRYEGGRILRKLIR